ncbi:MAG: ABC transporter ATP-binding protein [Gemmataceae bacterium]|nr:ABC transporter ATP-binding protein [Gemmataceae bacterium]
MIAERGASVRLDGVHKTFPNGFEALRGVDLGVEPGEWLVLVGPSGCGKTTTLRIIAGLEMADRGSIAIGGNEMGAVPPWRRGVAMAFQRPALAPTSTVRQNLALGTPENAGDVVAVAEVLGLTAELDRLPHQLSGGQQQRVNLGRALARRAPVCLLDEPLGHLDAPLRDELRRELLAWHQRGPGTVISVTHDPREAWALGQRVAVMEQGRVLQVGPPADVYRQPCSRFVAAFFAEGPMNFFEVQLRNAGDSLQWFASHWPDPIPVSSLHVSQAEASQTEVTLGLRAEDVRVGPPGRHTIKATLIERTPRGCWVTGDMNGRTITGWSEVPVTSGTPVGIAMDWTKAYMFDRVTGATLHAPLG